MKRRSVGINSRLYAMLVERSHASGRSIAALLEEAVGAYLGVDTRAIRMITDLKRAWRMT